MITSAQRPLRILLVGAFRPQGTVLGDHSQLGTLVQEVSRYSGDVTIDLDESDARGFCDELLDQEPNRLGRDFRSQLLGKTGGNPLFMVELLRSFRDEGVLTQQDGVVVLGRPPDWGDLSGRLEAVLQERLSRLERPVQELACAAAVGGPRFAAEPVAEVLDRKLLTVLRTLNDVLWRDEDLVRAEATPPGFGQLSMYRFRHSLIAEYAYNRLVDQHLRRQYHAATGEILAKAASDRRAVAMEIARHFELGGRPVDAARWLHLAVEAMNDRRACDAAIQAANRALDLLADHTTGECDELTMNLHLEKAEAAYHLNELDTCRTSAGLAAAAAKELGAEVTRAQALLLEGKALWKSRHYERSELLLREALDLARTHDDDELVAEVEVELAVVLSRTGRLEDALRAYDVALAVGSERVRRMACNNKAVAVGGILGRYEEAVPLYLEALRLAQEAGVAEQLYLRNLACYRRFGRYEDAASYLTRSAELARSLDDAAGEAAAKEDVGNLLLNQGRLHEAEQEYRSSLRFLEEAASRGRPVQSPTGVTARTLLAVCLLLSGNLEQSRSTAEMAVAERDRHRFPMDREIGTPGLALAMAELALGHQSEAHRLRAAARFVSEAERVASLFEGSWAPKYDLALALAGQAAALRDSAVADQAEAAMYQAVEYCGYLGVVELAIIVLTAITRFSPPGLLEGVENILHAARSRAIDDA